MKLSSHGFTVDIDDSLIKNEKISQYGYLNAEHYFGTFGATRLKTLHINGKTAVIGPIKDISACGIPAGQAVYHFYDLSKNIIELLMPYFTNAPAEPIVITDGNDLDCFVCQYPEFTMVIDNDTHTSTMYANGYCFTVSETSMLDMVKDFKTLMYDRYDVESELENRYGTLPSDELTLALAYEYAEYRDETAGDGDCCLTWRDCLDHILENNQTEIETDIKRKETKQTI